MSGNRIINVFGEPIEIVVTSKSSNYTCCVGIQTSPPGGGPPPHKHEREDETFVVLDGSFDLFDRDSWRPLRPGDVAFSPRGHFHGFRNTGESPGRMMFMTNGGALDEYFALISSMELPRDFDRFTEVSRHFGYVFLPMPGAAAR